MKKNYLLFFMALFTGTLLSVLVFFNVSRWENEKISLRFEADAFDRIAAVRNSLNTAGLVVESVRNFFYHSDQDVTQQEFSRFSGPFFNLYPGVHALEWIPRVPADRREAYEQAAGNNGLMPVRFMEKKMDGGMRPAGEKAEYYPVYLVASRKKNENIYGLDMSSDPVFPATADRAVRTGRPAVSSGIDITPENGFGFLLLAAVYDTSEPPETDALRHACLKGFAAGIFRIGDIVEKSLDLFSPAGIDIYLTDLSAPEESRLLYHHISRIGDSMKTDMDAVLSTGYKGLRKISEFSMGGRKWAITCVPGKRYISRKNRPFSWIILLGGLILTGLFARNMYRFIRESENICHIAEDRSEALIESENRLELALKSAQLGIWDWNVRTGEAYFNEQWAEMLGYLPAEIDTHVNFWAKLIHPDDRPEVMALLQAHLRGKTGSYRSEHRLRTKSGEWIWILNTGRVVSRDADGRALRAVGIYSDITARRLKEDRLRRQALILEQIAAGIVMTDFEGMITDWNPGAEKLFGYSREEAVGKPLAFLHHPAEAALLTDQIIDGIKNDGQWRGEINVVRRNGEQIICETVMVPFVDEKGRQVATIGVNRDITQRKADEALIRHMARHDALTDLPNRTLFMDRLSISLAVARRRKTITAVMFIDLDRFKRVNDLMGHDAGDTVLKQVAVRILDCVRESDTVGRLGGDEFVALFNDISGREDIVHIAERILLSLNRTFYTGGREAHIGCSIGIALFPEHGKMPEDLLKKADEAMYRIKTGKKNAWAFAENT